THDCLLIATCAMTAPVVLSAVIGRVEFYFAAEQTASALHRFANAVIQEPCRTVGDAEIALHLKRRDAFLRVHNERSRLEPLRERHMAFIEYRARSRAELVATIAALEQMTGWYADFNGLL